jgi:hypothetical protein
MPPIDKCPVCGSRKKLVEKVMNSTSVGIKKYLRCKNQNCQFDVFYFVNPLKYTSYRISFSINKLYYVVTVDIDLKRVLVRNLNKTDDYTIYKDIIIPFELGIEGIRNKVKLLRVWG